MGSAWSLPTRPHPGPSVRPCARTEVARDHMPNQRHGPALNAAPASLAAVP